jgi:hypothetical protein
MRVVDPQSPYGTSEQGVQTWYALELKLIDDALQNSAEREGGNKAQASKGLGMSRKSLHERLREVSVLDSLAPQWKEHPLLRQLTADEFLSQQYPAYGQEPSLQNAQRSIAIGYCKDARGMNTHAAKRMGISPKRLGQILRESLGEEYEAFVGSLREQGRREKQFLSKA